MAEVVRVTSGPLLEQEPVAEALVDIDGKQSEGHAPSVHIASELGKASGAVLTARGVAIAEVALGLVVAEDVKLSESGMGGASGGVEMDMVITAPFS